jgi:hypothetical protein
MCPVCQEGRLIAKTERWNVWSGRSLKIGIQIVSGLT